MAPLRTARAKPAPAKALARPEKVASKPPNNARQPGERTLIASLRRKAVQHNEGLAGPSALALGIGDDCAILRPGAADEIAVTTDLFLEGVHFRRDWHRPEIAGHRCLARGLSDLAAMGATPLAAFLSFALPPELAGDWARRFVSGLLRLAHQHNLPLAGGDTARAPAAGAGGRAGRSALFMADITLLGGVRRGRSLLRSGARVGDAIYVTGALGGAAAELALLEQDAGRYTHMVRARKGHPHLFPEPRVAVGKWLLGRATAAIDLSDGLSTDLAHLCVESRVAAEIEAARVPVHPVALRAADAGLALALHGGEDYELLFTVPGRRLPAAIDGVRVHRIGTIVKAARGKPRVSLVDAEGRRTALRNGGWEHFRSSQERAGG